LEPLDLIVVFLSEFGSLEEHFEAALVVVSSLVDRGEEHIARGEGLRVVVVLGHIDDTLSDGGDGPDVAEVHLDVSLVEECADENILTLPGPGDDIAEDIYDGVGLVGAADAMETPFLEEEAGALDVDITMAEALIVEGVDTRGGVRVFEVIEDFEPHTLIVVVHLEVVDTDDDLGGSDGEVAKEDEEGKGKGKKEVKNVFEVFHNKMEIVWQQK
jgi:hypothetical protein